MSERMHRYRALIELLKSYGRVAVAFSAGVDSTFLLAAAQEVLQEQVLALSVTADWIPVREQQEAVEFCKKQGIRHIQIKVAASDIEGFAANDAKRCYFCKKVLFQKMSEVAKREGIVHLLEGSNVDDMSDYRPGMRAIEELGIHSPLRQTGWTKALIREQSQVMGLETAAKASFACLASRIPYGEEITKQKLQMVELAEQYLYERSFGQFRVRVHGSLARIELLQEDFSKAISEPFRTELYEALRKIGFSYVALDLYGYRTGSMNETLSLQEAAEDKACLH